jgi:hypothetical protein
MTPEQKAMMTILSENVLEQMIVFVEQNRSFIDSSNPSFKRKLTGLIHKILKIATNFSKLTPMALNLFNILIDLYETMGDNQHVDRTILELNGLLNNNNSYKMIN